MDPSALPKDNRLALRRVARSCRKAALATISHENGWPYVSLVTVAFDHDLSPVLLLSGLSDHTRNLLADGRASLLLDGTEGLANPQTGPRVTLTGMAGPTRQEHLKRRFLACHPGAALYAGFADFSFWRVEAERAHFVGGFGRAVWFDAPFALPPSKPFVAAEEGLLAEFAAIGEERLVAVDPDGCHLAKDDRVRFRAFDQPAETPDEARRFLGVMARGA